MRPAWNGPPVECSQPNMHPERSTGMLELINLVVEISQVLTSAELNHHVLQITIGLFKFVRNRNAELQPLISTGDRYRLMSQATARAQSMKTHLERQDTVRAVWKLWRGGREAQVQSGKQSKRQISHRSQLRICVLVEPVFPCSRRVSRRAASPSRGLSFVETYICSSFPFPRYFSFPQDT